MRAFLAALCAACAAMPAATRAAGPQAGGELGSYERCLLERIERADPAVTAAEMRDACAPLRPASPQAGPQGGVPAEASGSATAEASASAAAEASGVPPVDSVIASRDAADLQLWSRRLAFLPHRPNYLLPFAWSEDIAESGPAGTLQPTEVKFQLSLKLPLTRPRQDERWSVFFAYTGQFWWQAYNSDRSSPFREYNHEPELFVRWPLEWRLAGWTLREANLGFNHQSNGQTVARSRSWNRVFADFRIDRPGGWWMSVRPWWRIPEDPKPVALAAEGDDNPDITRYLGHGEFRIGDASGRAHWTLMLRYSPSGNKGAAQLDWSVPTGFNPQVRWYVQLFDGYGESLIDYDRRVRRIGFGVMLNDWY